MIYDVDTERIEIQLDYLEQCIRVMQETLEDLTQKPGLVSFFAASRAVHIAVECVIDVGSVMIDGFIMRDPGGYLDIIDILEDEQVVPSDGTGRLKEWVRLRDRLVRRYHEVDHEELASHLKDIGVFTAYTDWVRDYLTRELGPAYPKRKEGSR
ncbi:DUF86 domain-containing protein [Paludifilum halophilum]|uniref:DUF86 domain-containing protein n=1 Tax=Paludifilum halophilum TaxID=1642702 RepID=A0A235B4S0_9BACL|nr:HepT-like ribonuclease domain-containing protein [Paludifilum halophilum]OYD07231.1 hypothetical protein CHM34_12675 [Paludifilum halophilum]